MIIYKNSLIITNTYLIDDEFYINLTLYYNYGFLKYKKEFISYKINPSDAEGITKKQIITITKNIIDTYNNKLK